jgi:hypothetical protein
MAGPVSSGSLCANRGGSLEAVHVAKLRECVDPTLHCDGPGSVGQPVRALFDQPRRLAQLANFVVAAALGLIDTR